MPLVLGEVLRRNAAVAPERAAVVHRNEGRRQVLTYRALDEQANQVAHLLLDGRRASPGSRVAYVSRNHIELPVAMWGAVKAGCVAVPLSFRATPGELVPHLEATRPVLVVAEADRADDLVASGAVDPDRLLVIGDGPTSWPRLAAAMAGAPTTEPAVAVAEDDCHLLVCTSGSTGRPKRVAQSHRAYVLQTGNPVFSDRGTGEHDVGLCTYQLFHSSGWRTCVIYWRARATVVTLRRPDPAEVVDAVEAERVTQIAAVPQTLRDLVRSGLAAGRDLRSVHAVNTGTSATSTEDVSGLEAVFGVGTVRVHYGASEAGPVASLHGHEQHDRPGSVGRPTLHVDVRVVGAPSGDGPQPPAGLGTSGEIVVRNEFLMSGYDGDPDATAEVLRHGWYATGDLGHLDEDGYLYVTGRVGDVIRSAGESIQPAEVEACLAEHPDVEDCAVVGIPDERWGEGVAAVVVVPGELDGAALRDHVAARLARYKVPRLLVAVDQVPRSVATGKVERAKVRALIAAQVSEAER